MAAVAEPVMAAVAAVAAAVTEVVLKVTPVMAEEVVVCLVMQRHMRLL